jgi:hypothetical protein
MDKSEEKNRLSREDWFQAATPSYFFVVGIQMTNAFITSW